PAGVHHGASRRQEGRTLHRRAARAHHRAGGGPAGRGRVARDRDGALAARGDPAGREWPLDARVFAAAQGRSSRGVSAACLEEPRHTADRCGGVPVAAWPEEGQGRMRPAHRHWLATLTVLLVGRPLAAQTTVARPPVDTTARSVEVVAGAHYAAGWFHRLMLGAHYRDLWTTPLRVEVLDLKTYAGGLTRPCAAAAARPSRSDSSGQTVAHTYSARSTRTRRSPCLQTCARRSCATSSSTRSALPIPVRLL